MPKSTDNKEQILVSFQIKGIEVLDFCLNHPERELHELNEFHFDIRLEHKFNVNKDNIAVFTYVDIFGEDHINKYASLTISCMYEIGNIKDFLDKNNNPILPDEFIITLNSISISTTRGIIYSQFRGTFLHKACLPIIDPKAFVLQ